MYLQARITVDPSAATQLVQTRPTKGFGRLAGVLSKGLKSPEEEQETFSALTILQQLFIVLRSLGVNDIVRISKDREVLFDDVTGKPDDLKPALEQTIKNLGRQQLQVFNSLTLALLHNTRDQTYLLQLRVHRTHAVGEHPLQLVVNAFPRALAVDEDEDESVVARKLSAVFQDQSRYDGFVAQQRKALVGFLQKIQKTFRDRMQVDAVKVTTSVRIVRPNSRVSTIAEIPLATHNSEVDPAFSGCFGTGAAFFYAWLWVDLCQQQSIRCSNCLVVDANGVPLETLDGEGVEAGSYWLFNLNTTAPTPSAGVTPGGTAAATFAAAAAAALCSTGKSTVKPTARGESWLKAMGRLLLPEPGNPHPDPDIDFNNIEYGKINPSRLEIKPINWAYEKPSSSSSFGDCSGCGSCSGCNSW
ncbi:MAG: hypothetical protein VX346_17530 [Planctomycetota bacterium]|nr:hypothetical protein [Planctomycetota bacterium]